MSDDILKQAREWQQRESCSGHQTGHTHDADCIIEKLAAEVERLRAERDRTPED